MVLIPKFLQAVQEAGYTEPTPIQTAAIPPILAGHDLIGIAQTGTGKTAAFTLPILTKLAAAVGGGRRRGTRVLVLAPTRELVAADRGERARLRASICRCASPRSSAAWANSRKSTRCAPARTSIIACPGRLLDLMGRRCADFSGLQFLVLDEADRMLDMGFLPDIRRIVRALPTEAADAAVLRHPLEGDRGAHA